MHGNTKNIIFFGFCEKKCGSQPDLTYFFKEEKGAFIRFFDKWQPVELKTTPRLSVRDIP